jgi:hypothetical protein
MMLNYQQVIEEIRSFLQATDQTLTDRLRELAAEYAQACLEVNQRLRRCEDFLQRGLRSEAVHLAQADPDLLDQVAILDFPEKPQWEEVLLTYSIPSPPRLLLLTAEALNEAYSLVQPLEQLLRKHRLLALARAPLMARLGVMRQIAKLDAGNPVWAEDIGEFEKVRIRQLESAIAHAQEHGDTRTLDKLFTEIRTTEWVTAPPLHLIERVENMAKQRQRSQFRDALRTLENEVHDAVAACDVERVRRLRERWNEEAVRGNLTMKDPVWERVTPAFDWLEEQDRRQAEERKYKAAILKLEQGLKDNAPLEELHQLYRTLMVREGGIPEDLELRYQTRAEVLRSSARRRKRLLIFAGAAAAVIVIGFSFNEWWQGRQKRKLDTITQALRKLGEEREYASAKKLLDDFEASEPRLADRPEFASTKQKVIAEFNREQERLERFQAAYREAEMAPLDERGNAAVEKVRAEARLSSERNAIDRLVKDREKKIQQLQEQNNQKFRVALDDLRNQIQDLEQVQLQTPNAPKVLTGLTNLQKKLAELRDMRGITTSMRDLLLAPAERLETLRKSCGQSEHQTELTNRLAEAAQSTMTGEEYAKILQDYAKEFPLSPRGKAFQQVLQEQPHWQAVLAWNRLVQPWLPRPLDVNFADAKTRSGQIRAFQQAHPQFVDAATVGHYLLYLEAVGQQEESAPESAAAKLRQLFTSVRIKNLWVLREGDRTYYLVKDPKGKIDDAKEAKEDYVAIRHLADPDAKEKPQKVLLRNITKIARAPQSELAEKVQRMPPNFADRTWEQAVLTIIQGIQDNRDMDPILQVYLLKHVFELAGKGSYPLALAVKEPLRGIEDAKLDLEVPWINPVSESARNLRPLARNLRKKLPSSQDLRMAVAQQQERLTSAMDQSSHEVAGWLAWEKDTGWQCRSKRPVEGNWSLAVVVPQPNQTAVWRVIGKVVDGKVQLEADNDPALREGRVIFATRSGMR